MASFNFTKFRNLISNDLPQVSLPRIPAWANRAMGTEERESEHDSDEDAEDALIQAKRTSMRLTEPMPIDTSKPKSYLDLLNECDSFPYFSSNPQLFTAHMNLYYGLYVRDYPDTELGYILPSVVEVFRGLPGWEIDDKAHSLTLLAGDSEEERTAAVAFVTQAMRATDHFAILKGWRNELYPVYGPRGNVLFSIERAASALFGVVTYGCHMTAYTYSNSGDDDEREMKMWVPRRAADKQTYGGMLDNTVAGGLSTNEKPLDCLIRESAEEASLPEELVRRKAKAVGTVTYFYIRDARAGGEIGLLQPECQYVYDLELDSEVVPKPGDDEVERFELMTIPQVKEAMREGEFKPNCALVLLDFFVRHGVLTSDDSGFVEIVARLHRRLDFPMP